jgi:hypothetical protein
MNLVSFYGLIASLLFFFLVFSSKRIFKGFFNPFIFSIITFSISFSTVLFLYDTGHIESKVFFNILIFYFIFIFAYAVFSFLVSKGDNLNYYNSAIKKIDYQVLYVLFVISFAVSSMYIILLWSSYSTGDERLLLNREIRGLSLINTLFSFWVVVLASLIYAQKKQFFILMILVITISLAFFSGSKGGALGLLLWAIYFYSNFNRISLARLFLMIFSIIVVLMLPTWWMYGSDFLKIILYRLSMSGDVYTLSFISGDYTQLIDMYEPIGYFLHPFTSLVGIRGYDFPFGAELVGTAGRAVNGTGPNPHLPMLAITFWPNSFLASFLCALFFAFVFLFFVFIAFKFYNTLFFPLYLRIYIFSSLLLSAFTIFIDIGMSQFFIVLNLIAFLVFLFFFFLCKVFNKRYDF